MPPFLNVNVLHVHLIARRGILFANLRHDHGGVAYKKIHYIVHQPGGYASKGTDAQNSPYLLDVRDTNVPIFLHTTLQAFLHLQADGNNTEPNHVDCRNSSAVHHS